MIATQRASGISFYFQAAHIRVHRIVKHQTPDKLCPSPRSSFNASVACMVPARPRRRRKFRPARIAAPSPVPAGLKRCSDSTAHHRPRKLLSWLTGPRSKQRGRNQRRLCQITSIVDHVPRIKIIAAIEDQVVLRNQLNRVVGYNPIRILVNRTSGLIERRRASALSTFGRSISSVPCTIWR